MNPEAAIEPTPPKPKNRPRKGTADPKGAEAKSARSTRETLGEFLRTQRRIAGLSLRQLADITSVSNAYLSQIERGKHKPSIEVLRAVATGLNVSAETLLDQVGLFEDPAPTTQETASDARATEAAILSDPQLTPPQREALIAVYRSYASDNQADD
ncbi:MAG: helix-turn-helix domain-containing protein [Deltaproteobacteria bacterium]|nr:helix-turn-helix domain-containing protein [Deltaproteobacteria bacterium]